MRTFLLLACMLSVAFGRSFLRSPRADKNIVQLAESVKDLSTLVTALTAGKLVTALEGKGPFTVFAPSNEAFAKIPKAELEKLLDPKDIKTLDAILEYHVVAGAAVHAKDLKPENKFKTLEGSELLVEVRDGHVYVNRESRVTAADNDASNGVVHIIDRVLIPRAPSPPPAPPAPAPTKNIVALAESVKDLSTLVTALTAGKLVTALEGKGPFTVFAPSNEAFAKIPKAELEKLLDPKNIKTLDAILEYHVVAGAAVHAKDLKRDNKFKTLEGSEIDVEKSPEGRVYVNRKTHVTSADNDATNGVVHIIDGVLIPHKFLVAAPTKNIVQLAESVKDLSTLVTALTAGKLVTALEGKGPFTVFAPSNEAFAKIPKAELEKLLDPKNIKTLDAILEYHVVAGAAVHAKDLKPENKFKTLEGSELLVEVRDGKVYINRESHVTAADNDASNGVVHIIDAVLIPKAPSPPPAPAPTKDIVALAESVKDLSTLVTALTAGKLVTTLQGKGPFTVFAPTNEAFAHLNPAVLKYLLEPEHIKELDAVLEYHVVEGAAVFSKDLKQDQEFKTVEGREIEVEKYGTHVRINKYAHVTSADNAATNGVVHIIDRVLVFHDPLAMQK